MLRDKAEPKENRRVAGNGAQRRVDEHCDPPLGRPGPGDRIGPRADEEVRSRHRRSNIRASMGNIELGPSTYMSSGGVRRRFNRA